LPVLLRIPLEREIGEGLAQGKTLLEIHPEYEVTFRNLYTQIAEKIAQSAVIDGVQ
jgi:nitrogenase subunit NifH